MDNLIELVALSKSISSILIDYSKSNVMEKCEVLCVKRGWWFYKTEDTDFWKYSFNWDSLYNGQWTNNGLNLSDWSTLYSALVYWEAEYLSVACWYLKNHKLKKLCYPTERNKLEWRISLFAKGFFLRLKSKWNKNFQSIKNRACNWLSLP